MDQLKFEKESFSNPAAFEILEPLTRHLHIFLSRKRANEFKGILMAIGAAFPEDRAVIYQTLGDGGAKRKTRKPTGGAKITRRSNKQQLRTTKGDCEGCPKNERSMHSGATPGFLSLPPNTIVEEGVKETRTTKGDCEGCPENERSIHSGATPGFLSLPPTTIVEEGVKETPALLFKTWQELQEAFEGNAVAMRAFASDRGIKIPGNIRRADTMAKTLFLEMERKAEQASGEEEE